MVNDFRSGTDTKSAIWAQAATCSGIISACMPIYKPLFKDLGFASSSKRPMSVSQPRSKVNATDTYKTLDGQEPSRTGSNGSSKIELVSHERWKVPRPMTKTTAQGPAERADVEMGLSHHVIKVTNDVDVSSAKAR